MSEIIPIASDHAGVEMKNRLVAELKKLGYQPDELIGQQMHELTHHSRPDGSPYPASECPIHLAAVKGIPCQVSDEVMWRKDGRDMQVEYVASPVREQGRLTARDLAGAGINVDLAPVLDVGRPGGAIGGEGRSFGATASKVSETAVPFAGALQAGGVAATGKHFPGLGAAEVNTDLGVERIGLPKETLRDVDEVPFRSFVAAGGKLVMMSSAIYPGFSERPAAFARTIATGELRGRLGFEGVSVTDDLQSTAVHAFGGSAKVGRAAALAGTDLLLFRSYRAAAQAGTGLRGALKARVLPRAEFERSVQRVLDLRAGLRF
jgi:beta-N-acetylhexosaminidase